MAYRRRYYLPFVGTTETIGDKSITEDKVDDGAIATRHLATGAVTSPKILDETIVSEDIKAGEVKTSDLANNSVTSYKLADNAVTTYKYAYKSITGSKIADATITSDKFVDAPITRPITPALDTPEIGDGKVTAAKLAGDAVETAKIKDDAVTSAKIAPDSILAGDIAANAIEGAEIKDGAVGTGKLATDAVETVKIKDANVTAPKLEADILRKHLEDRQVFYDDFLGAVLNDRWAQSGETGGSANMAARSKVLIATPATLNAYYRINWNGKRGVFVGKLPKFFAKVTPTGDPDLNVFVGLYKSVNDLIWFGYEPGVGFNWLARCISGGGVTTVDTGVVADDTPVELLIDVVSVGEVKFYINGVLKATINTDIPATVDVEPWLEVQALTAGVVSLAVDNVIISAESE